MARGETLNLLGVVGRHDLDEAQRALVDAQRRVESAEAAVREASDRLRDAGARARAASAAEQERLTLGLATAGDAAAYGRWIQVAEGELDHMRRTVELARRMAEEARATERELREAVARGLDRRDVIEGRVEQARRAARERRDLREADDRPWVAQRPVGRA